MPLLPRQTTHSKVREGLSSIQAYVNDNSWIQYIGAEDMDTDGPRLFLTRAHSIMLSPTIERRVFFTRPPKETITNGRPNVIFRLVGETAPVITTDEDVELTLNIWTHKIDDLIETEGVSVFSGTQIVTLLDTTIHEIRFEAVFLTDPRIESDDVLFSYELVHTPTNVANNYTGDVFLLSCNLQYVPNIEQ